MPYGTQPAAALEDVRYMQDNDLHVHVEVLLKAFLEHKPVNPKQLIARAVALV